MVVSEPASDPSVSPPADATKISVGGGPNKPLHFLYLHFIRAGPWLRLAGKATLRALAMGRRSPPRMAEAHLSVPLLEAYLRAEVEAGNMENAFPYFERLIRRRRTPHQTVCTGLLQLAASKSVRRAMYVLESTCEHRAIEVEDFTRIIRLFCMQRPDFDTLHRFHEIAVDIINFSDDSMHNYFAHYSLLLNLELLEQLTASTQDGGTQVCSINSKGDRPRNF